MNCLIVVDTSKCIGCRAYGVAYVVSYRENRDCASPTPEAFSLHTHIIKGVNTFAATVCRQCEDTPYANIYLNSAISRDKRSIRITQEHCIGCRTCAVAYPHGAMRMVVRLMIRNSGAGLNVRANKAGTSKCNLCNRRGDGPVRMTACSTHTLICIDRSKFKQLSAERRRRTALMFQKFHKTVLILKELLEIFVKYETGSTADP